MASSLSPDLELSRRVTTSVGYAVSRLEEEYRGEPISAWRMVQEVLRLHDEYGARQGKRVRELPGPGTEEGVARPVSEWISMAAAILDPEKVGVIHGRLLLFALSEVEPSVGRYLRAQGDFLDALGSELQEPFESLLVSSPRIETPEVAAPAVPASIDSAPLHLDSPAADDRLGRRGFARALAIRLERIWREMNPAGRPAKGANQQGSFVLHLHGPWGAGKSSILSMLRRGLQSAGRPPAAVAVPWVVVDFNAWQNQRLNPPWWPLMDGIYRQSVRQIPWWRRIWLFLREHLWRFSIKRRDLLMFAAFVLALGFVGFRYLRPALFAQMQEVTRLSETAKQVTDVAAVLTLVTGWIWLGSRSLISGSTRAAQSFLDSAADPMDRIQDHFQRMVRTVDRPIAVFVDDLDRCQAAYVVQLLEGIQTLFRDPRVVYVIAADQRWLHACFESTYEAFTDSVREPGRRLGSLFLEKAFEISVAVPEISPEVRADYWRFLLGGEPAWTEERMAGFEQQAREEFRHDRSEQQVVARLESASSAPDQPLREQARRQVAVERLASAAVEKDVSYFLQPFAPLLEPNPRSMKRLLNAYAIRRDLAILSGLDVLADPERRKKLALWTLLSLRWPALEEYLRDKAAGSHQEPSAEVTALLKSPEVREVVEGKGLGGPLTLDDLRELLGFGRVAAEKSA